MIQQYRLAFKAFSRMFWLLLSFSSLLASLEYLLDSGTFRIGANLCVYAIVALMAHRAILLDKAVLLTIRFGDKFSVWRFLWRYSGFVLAAALFWRVSVYGILQVIAPPIDDKLFGVFPIALIPTWIAFAIMISLFGTALPAAAIEGDASLSTARSRGGFFRTFARLIFGNLLAAIICTVIVIGASILILDTPDGLFFTGILGTLLGFFPFILIAAALSLAYMETEGGSLDAGERP